MAKQFEAQQLEKTGGGMRGSTEVVLTAAQRERILAATGIKLESVRIRDEAGIVARTMPATDPRIIEYRALKEAERLKIEQEARALLRVQLERLLADLESKSPALAGKVAELRADPNYADGVLHTKT